MVGSILTGVFATTAVNAGGADGLLYGGAGLVLVQVVGVVAAATFAAIGTGVILGAIEATVGLRAPIVAEEYGIDLIEHAERAYARDEYTLAHALAELRAESGRLT